MMMSVRRTDPSHPATQCIISVNCLRNERRPVSASSWPAGIRETPGRILSGIRALRHTARYDGNACQAQRCGVVPSRRGERQYDRRRSNRRPRVGGRIRRTPAWSAGNRAEIRNRSPPASEIRTNPVSSEGPNRPNKTIVRFSS